jgi:hypothetical protein
LFSEKFEPIRHLGIYGVSSKVAANLDINLIFTRVIEVSGEAIALLPLSLFPKTRGFHHKYGRAVLFTSRPRD